MLCLAAEVVFDDMVGVEGAVMIATRDLAGVVAQLQPATLRA